MHVLRDIKDAWFERTTSAEVSASTDQELWSLLHTSVAVAAMCVLSVPLHFAAGNLLVARLASFGAVGFLASYFIAARGGGQRASAAVFHTTSLIALALALFLDGGLESAATPWLVVLPGIAFAIGGERVAVGAVAGGIAVVLGLLGLALVTGELGVATITLSVNLAFGAVATALLHASRERALARVQAEVRKEMAARVAADSANDSKSRVLAAMSHELRTPLNGILGTVELLLEDDVSDSHRAQLEVVQDSGRLLLTILGDVLDSARLDAGMVHLDPVPTDPVLLVDRTVELLSACARKRSVSLSAVHTGARRDWARLDEHRVQQVLVNLIGNGVKFTERGGKVTVVHGWVDGALQVEVVDTGIGISKDRLEAIFHPFEQAEGGTARRYGGAGLGLSICRRLADQMGGSLTVTSEPGVGSTFTLRLPAEPVSAPATDKPVSDDPPVAPVVPPASPAAPERVLSVLVVDDNAVNREVLKQMVARLGHRATVACDGRSAVALCGEADVDFDCVLMDVEMPELDGLEATRRIHAMGTCARLPIYAVSAGVFPEDRQRALDAGMDGFLAKPLRLSDVRGLLSGLRTTTVGPSSREGTG